MIKLPISSNDRSQLAPELADTDRGPNRHEPEVGARLREAVGQAGGTNQVAERAGIPIRTLSRYLTGHEMRRSALVSLAEACGVSIEWLATGRGSMRPTDRPDVARPEKLGRPAFLELFGTVDMDRMGRALEAAIKAFTERGIPPDWRRLAQVAMLLYDSQIDPDNQADAVTRALATQTDKI